MRSARFMAQRQQQAADLFIKADRQIEQGHLRSGFHLMLSSAELGDSSAQVNVGYAYDVGSGVRRNRKRALYWYRRAFKAGERTAAANIGTIYRDKGNLQRALFWFKRAAALGDADANLEIAKIFLERNRTGSAVTHLKKVVKASKTDVTVSAKEEAQRMLRQASRLGRG